MILCEILAKKTISIMCIINNIHKSWKIEATKKRVTKIYVLRKHEKNMSFLQHSSDDLLLESLYIYVRSEVRKYTV